MSDVQVVLNASLRSLAYEIGTQVGDNFTYADVIHFIELIDKTIGDSVFSTELLKLTVRLVTE